MDAKRFDAIARNLIAATSRRRTLGSFIGGALGLLGLAVPETSAAKSGKCKPKCGPCEKCQKGDCDKENGKKKCKKGKCRPKPAGAPCTAFPGGACQNGTCINLKTDEANCGSLGTVCPSNQVCQEGSCFPSSTCPATTTLLCVSGSISTTCGADCFCSLSAEGNVVCVEIPPIACPSMTPCTTSATCAAGEACVETGSCCAEGVPAHACFARCPTA